MQALLTTYKTQTASLVTVSNSLVTSLQSTNTQVTTLGSSGYAGTLSTALTTIDNDYPTSSALTTASGHVTTFSNRGAAYVGSTAPAPAVRSRS